MNFELVSRGPYPLSFRIAMLLTIGFVFVAVPIARRNRFPLLILALPLSWGFAAAFLGLANVAGAQSVSGGGRFASAAGVAEAHIPLKWCCYAIAVVSVLYAWKVAAAPHSHRVRESRILALLTAIALILLCSDFWPSTQLLSPNTAQGEWKFMVGVSLGLVAVLLLLAAMAVVIRGRSASGLHASRKSVLILASGSFVTAIVLREIVARLHSYVISGGLSAV